MLGERYADAAETSARGLTLARRTQQGQPLAALLIYRAGALGNLLELDAAKRTIDAAEESARLQRLPHVLAYALWQRALIHHFQAATREARTDAAELTELIPSLEPNRLSATGLCGAAAIAADEDPERCLHTIRRVAGAQLDTVLPTWWAALLLCMVRYAFALDRHHDAEHWATLARERAGALRLPRATAAPGRHRPSCCSLATSPSTAPRSRSTRRRRRRPQPA